MTVRALAICASLLGAGSAVAEPGRFVPEAYVPALAGAAIAPAGQGVAAPVSTASVQMIAMASGKPVSIQGGTVALSLDKAVEARMSRATDSVVLAETSIEAKELMTAPPFVLAGTIAPLSWALQAQRLATPAPVASFVPSHSASDAIASEIARSVTLSPERLFVVDKIDAVSAQSALGHVLVEQDTGIAPGVAFASVAPAVVADEATVLDGRAAPLVAVGDGLTAQRSDRVAVLEKAFVARQSPAALASLPPALFLGETTGLVPNAASASLVYEWALVIEGGAVLVR